jgi:hypothetical protein
MRKNVLVFGAIAGVITIIWMIRLMFESKIDFENGELIGYATMLLAFSTIFVAVKNFRDKQNGGTITFGKAFRLGLGITLIASTIYVITWLIYYYVSGTDFVQQYGAYYTEQMRSSGASEVAIQSQMKEMETFVKMYKNPFINALFTYMEILPVGVLVSLIAALVLKRRKDPTDLVDDLV